MLLSFQVHRITENHALTENQLKIKVIGELYPLGYHSSSLGLSINIFSTIKRKLKPSYIEFDPLNRSFQGTSLDDYVYQDLRAGQDQGY